MIGFLDGVVAGRGPDGCFVDVRGVGYRLSCSGRTLTSLPRDGDSCRLWTYLHVRDDALSLYGFATEAEQTMFEGLLAVGGVGPKVALQVCSAFTPETFRRAVVTGDVEAIASVPGIGRKTAQRVVLDLKDRLGLPELEVVGVQLDSVARARSALENLGYSPSEARAALAQVEVSTEDRVEDVVKSALKVLG